MDHPSRVLAQARQHLEALKQSGLSRNELIALLGEESQPQPQPQSQPGQPTMVADGSSAIPNFSYRDVGGPSFTQPHMHRASIASSRSSCSSRDSVFSSISGRSSISSTTASSSTEAKFWCTSCDKTFKRKFDWKRHEEEFHERSRKYPCPNCNQSFWGPNTFNQHHKSAHGCKTCPHAESVVKHLRKRRAWGCGFCAAMHGKFEKHIDHVAAHFESGLTKADWWHSNVIYGLLHQHLVHEAWKSLVARKQSAFNGLQPMFSWSPESSGRAQGFVENENPGQLQDHLEFFDGTKESADAIAEMAYGCVHLILRPRAGSVSSHPSQHDSLSPQPTSAPAPSSSAHKSIALSASRPAAVPRRSASMSALSGPGRHGGRARNVPNATGGSPGQQQLSNLILSPGHQSMGPNAFQQQAFMRTPQAQPQRFTAPPPPQLLMDKALPPAPLAPTPTSPMNLDFPMFGTNDGGLLPPLDLSSDDWHSFTSTLVEEEQEDMAMDVQQHEHQHQHQHHHQHPHAHAHQQQPISGDFPMTWEDLGQFGPRGQ
ncbi:hypothetical protein GGS23DRAFT_205418 [Durotheca rogersii]|uniref:uncharacterized protein n=1 Tax=Durotheca rogersii TaxID=419775 RepID=UPI002220BED9|nr:uncharacterized protein GGS23DRAFT_205418 [Durotheca rogersii]KAI5861026.1 hypothetical protein GGS23DRAFT_205418 [Durotheca rogersii]